jgi:hypothetical protein
VDDDCDGVSDEEYVVDGSCGVGACLTNNTPSSCVSGVETACVPGTAALDDATCDGVDDDCDGVSDEGFVSTSASCGVGSCVASGVTVCVSGAVTDTCIPGTPAPDDATCDGIDDDCDGVADEDYITTPTICGVGGCESTGAISCIGGVVQDTCIPESPATDDATCDGIDDDCDGLFDEDAGGGCAGGTLISAGSVWRFEDTGADLGSIWHGSAFDDSGWSSGRSNSHPVRARFTEQVPNLLLPP